MNAISNRHFFIAAILIAAALFYWLSPKQDTVIPAAQNVTQPIAFEQTSDYGMSQFTMTIMDENGRPVRVIKGDKMTHFPTDDRTDIVNPIAEFLNEQQDTWRVTAKQGVTHGKGEEILLTDNVMIKRQDDNSTEMHTTVLTLNTEKSTAYTDEPVTMISPYGETQSVGLHATLDDKTINLHSRVKGQYDAPAPE